MQGRVLIVAGSDSGGGAGVQADIKAVSALSGYAATAITALTAQNTLGVQGILPVAPDFIQAQMRAVISDIGADCLKTGMLYDGAVIEAVCQVIEQDISGTPVVVDPVMVAKGGAALLDGSAVDTLKSRLVPLAFLLTPNILEAEAITGMKVTGPDGMEAVAKALLALGPGAVLLKGGHMEGELVRDLLATPAGLAVFENPRIETQHTHGTGCTLASAIAAGIAQGLVLEDAVARAEAYLHAAILAAPGLGAGHGSVGHMHTVLPFKSEKGITDNDQ